MLHLLLKNTQLFIVKCLGVPLAATKGTTSTAVPLDLKGLDCRPAKFGDYYLLVH